MMNNFTGGARLFIGRTVAGFSGLINFADKIASQSAHRRHNGADNNADRLYLHNMVSGTDVSELGQHILRFRAEMHAR
jgi:hypothetical protein